MIFMILTGGLSWKPGIMIFMLAEVQNVDINFDDPLGALEHSPCISRSVTWFIYFVYFECCLSLSRAFLKDRRDRLVVADILRSVVELGTD
jgi:hypothetical protein